MQSLTVRISLELINKQNTHIYLVVNKKNYNVCISHKLGNCLLLS